MNQSFFIKEIKESRWVLLAFMLFSCLAALVIPSTYKALFIAQQMTYDSYIWWGWFFQASTQFTVTAAIILGAVSFSKELRNDTIGFLVTKPVLRRNILFLKALAGFIILELLIVIPAIILYIASWLSGVGIQHLEVGVIGVLSVSIIVFPLYTLAMLFSIKFLNGIKAGMLAAGVMLLVYAPSWFGSTMSPVYIMMKNLLKLNPICVAIMLILGFVFYMLAQILFDNKEI